MPPPRPLSHDGWDFHEPHEGDVDGRLLSFSGERRGWWVTGDIAMVGSRLAVVAVGVQPPIGSSAPPEPLTAAVVNEIFRPQEIVRAALRATDSRSEGLVRWKAYWSSAPDDVITETTTWIDAEMQKSLMLDAAAREQPRRGRPKVPDEELEELALAWIELDGVRAPRQKLLDNESLGLNTLETVKWRISLARSRGWLAKPRRGESLHLPGPRLIAKQQAAAQRKGAKKS